MLKVRGDFATDAELAAFCDGVEFVNDSALWLVDRYEIDGRFKALYRDDDDSGPDDPEVAELQARGRRLD